MNKKGLVFEAIMTIPHLIFLALVVLCVFFLIYSFVQTDIDITQVEIAIDSYEHSETTVDLDPYSNRIIFFPPVYNKEDTS